jgi:hypothetical protein
MKNEFIQLMQQHQIIGRSATLYQGCPQCRYYFKAVGLEGDYYDLKDDIDFSEWLEYFADGILDELRCVRKILPEQTGATPRLEPHHKQILTYMEKNGCITQREYSAISSRNLASIKLDFDKLVKLKLIKAEGTRRGTYYVKVM